MNITHSQLVSALVKPGHRIKEEVTADEMHLLHMLLGVCGEAGELLDALKKAIVYRKPLDRVNVIEELGDLEFYLEGIRQGLGITREETLTANISKLSKRYVDLAYSDQEQERVDKRPPGPPRPFKGDFPQEELRAGDYFVSGTGGAVAGN